MNAIHGLIDVSLLNPQHFSSCVKKGHTLSHSSYERGTNSLRRTNRTGLLEPLRCKAASRLNQRQRGFCQHRHWLRRKYERLEFARGASSMWPMHDLFRTRRRVRRVKGYRVFCFSFLFSSLCNHSILCVASFKASIVRTACREASSINFFTCSTYSPFLVNVDQSYYSSRTSMKVPESACGMWLKPARKRTRFCSPPDLLP